MPRGDWPEGLSDEEAIQRLQSIVIGACEGVRDLANDREYKRLRRPLLSRDDLRNVVPSFIRSQRDLEGLWAHLRGVAVDRQARREHAWEAFRPLSDRLSGRTKAPAVAAHWTGRRSFGEQARFVSSIGRHAMDAVDMLLEEQERPLSNGGPVEPERLAAIQQLRELHSALGELIRLAEAEEPFAAQADKVRALKDKLFKWSAERYELLLYKTPMSASSTVLASAAWFLTNWVTKDPNAATAMAAVAGAGHVADVAQRRKSEVGAPRR